MPNRKRKQMVFSNDRQTKNLREYNKRKESYPFKVETILEIPREIQPHKVDKDFGICVACFPFVPFHNSRMWCFDNEIDLHKFKKLCRSYGVKVKKPIENFE
jgi:hypothetical protein